MKVSTIEELLDQPYMIIDILPYRVDARHGSNYFEFEKFFIKSSEYTILRKKFLNIILKLSCYFDILAYICAKGAEISAPSPQKLEELILTDEKLVYIIINEESSLISIDSTDTNMTVFSRSEKLKEILNLLVQSEGLFMWQGT